MNRLNVIGLLLLSSFCFIFTKTVFAQPFAYITNSTDDTVSIIDTSDNTVVDTVNVGSFPFGVAISPDGRYVYVTNASSDNVSVIDASNNTVVDTINVGAFPLGVAVLPNSSLVYVANANSFNISIIDTLSNTVVDIINLGTTAWSIAISPDGSLIYVSNSLDTIFVIDTSTNSVVDSIDLGLNTFPTSQIVFSPDGNFAYLAATSLPPTLYVIDTSTNAIVDSVGLGMSPVGIAVTPNGAFVYVANSSSNSVSVIDTSTYTVVDNISVSAPGGLSITPDGGFVYVTNSDSNTITVINTTTNTVVDTVQVGNIPISFGVFIGLPNPLSLFLLPLTPSEVGKQNTLFVRNATPGGNIAFIWGFTRQNVIANNICPGLEAGILNPRILATVQADGNGDADFSFNMPLVAEGLTVFIQAVDITSCMGSNVNEETIGTPPQSDIMLLPLNPGQAGQQNTITAIDATPNNSVRFIWGFNQGNQTANNICPGFQSGIINPKILTTVPSDVSGDADFTFNIQGGASGVNVVLQAVDLATCSGSNVNQETL